jgi:hypothetical protein
LDEGDDPVIRNNLEEIRSMRDEITWRVKTAYNASIIFTGAISLIVGSLFTDSNKFLDKIKDPDIMTICGIAILIAISAWVGVQNANHLIEKRIELYTLELMKVVYKRKKHVYFSWLGFLYGSVFFRKKYKNFLARFLSASIGMFMYFLPNLLTLCVWYYVYANGLIRKYMVAFIVATLFLAVAVGSTIMFFFYVVNVNAKFTAFYKKIMHPYFEKNGVKYD